MINYISINNEQLEIENKVTCGAISREEKSGEWRSYWLLSPVLSAHFSFHSLPAGGRDSFVWY